MKPAVLKSSDEDDEEEEESDDFFDSSDESDSDDAVSLNQMENPADYFLKSTVVKPAKVSTYYHLSPSSLTRFCGVAEIDSY